MASPSSILIAYRFVLFVLFVICNAIICSVAVWSHSMPEVTGRDSQISAYLIFVGAFGVVFIIPTVAIDLFRKNALTSRVWFECLWIGVFWVFELAGAAALTANMTNMTCSAVANTMDVCTSSLVLLGFTWVITVLLLIYLLGLTLSAILHQEDGVAVWQAGVRFFPWYKTRTSLNSAPASPTRQWKKPLQLGSARPQTARQATLAPPPRFTARDRAPKPEPSYEPSRPAPAPESMVQFSPEPASLYPVTLKSSLPRVNPPESSMPAPLGNWPRQPQQTSPSSVSPQSSTASSPGSSPSARPRHPRSGSGGSIGRSRPVPPPLDLTRISAYRNIDDQASRR